MIEKIIKSAKSVNIDVSEEQAKKLKRYYELLIEWNEKINLTSITEEDEVVLKHFTDSLCCIKTGLFKPDVSVIDVGTGAGFPSIPLKILCPECDFMLVDSLNKRINFLNLVIDELELKRIETVHSRAEDSGRSELRDRFDICVARAVASLPVLCELCMPHVRPGGHFVAMKGKDASEEAEMAKKAIAELGGRLESIENTGLSGLEHYNIVIKKLSNTNKKYPRKAGTPNKKPLI